jgi:CRISPR/Cas system-associated exonuclease Cas4 (RecB family)
MIMTKNLLQQIMIREVETPEQIDAKELVNVIQQGYLVGRDPEHKQKKTFGPSTIAYGHGECPRYWYLAFEGAVFEDNSDAYAVANMTNGTLSHGRIEAAFKNSGISINSEFKLFHDDPPIFGYVDNFIQWKGDEIVVEVKTTNNEVFEYRKRTNKPKMGHVVQLLIYMKVLKKSKGILVYENKNNHELLVIPVEVNDHYRAWIDMAFQWMRDVRKAWEDKTLPTKNYRSNSKICKNCPIKKACGEAGVGVVKIASLEELSEVM